MVTTALVTLFLAGPSLDASEYFPLLPGTKWVYRESRGKNSGLVTDEVRSPIDIAGEPAFPIETRVDGISVEKVFYRVSGDTVLIVAYDAKKPFDPPRPSFRVGPGPLKWDYEGSMPFVGEPVPISVKGSSQPRGSRKVLGTERECVEVQLEARVGPPGQAPIVSKQTALYAKGIGLVDMQTKTVAGKKTETSALAIVDFSLGKP